MIPPTPTPLPMGVSPITPPDVSLWNSAPDAIQFWNMIGAYDITIAFQGLIIAGMVFSIFMVVLRLMNRLTSDA